MTVIALIRVPVMDVSMTAWLGLEGGELRVWMTITCVQTEIPTDTQTIYWYMSLPTPYISTDCHLSIITRYVKLAYRLLNQ